MNILFAADVSISNVIGGAERVLFEQTTRLARKGHTIFVLTRMLPNHDKSYETIQGVHEWRYEICEKNPLFFLLSTLFNSRKIFENLHRKIKFDCINFHQPFSALGILKSSFSHKVPKIYTCHSLSFEEYISRNGSRSGITERVLSYAEVKIRKKLENDGLKNSEKIVVLSNFTKQKLIETYNVKREKVKVIQGGVDIDKFKPASGKLGIRRRLQIPPDKIILFTVRNLVSRMGLENLVIAFSKIVNEKPDLYLVIGGKGPLKEKLMELTKQLGILDKVYFPGFIAESDLPAYYQMSDLFVLPTRELEGFGLVTLEAMASGIPVVGTAIGGTKEIIGNFEPRFLFNGTGPGSITALISEVYETIICNPQEKRMVSRHCRKYVEDNYTWENNVRNLEDLLVNCLPN